jgi:Lar family restriction alleviation protein
MSENAKPCPFCGSTDLDPYGTEGTEAMVVCSDCLAQGPVATIGCRDPDEDEIDLDAEAVELWNKRSGLRLVKDLVKEKK